MSIITGFLTTPTGSINYSTSNQDLGSIFVAQNSSNNINVQYTDCSLNTFSSSLVFQELTSINLPGRLTVTFNTAGTYLLCISTIVNSNGDTATSGYSIGLSNYSSSSTVPFNNIAIATPQFLANKTNTYNGYPTSNTTIFTTTGGTYYLYYYLYYGDNNWVLSNITITGFFLTPYPT